MSYVALYRKYRPDNFESVVGQENIIKIIKNAVINNKVSHAYIFSGPRGTGKTTTAKIIARIVNCKNSKDGEPCGQCENCLSNNSNDIVEIDAASNNGIDEIRELKDKVNLVPSNAKYKIYIIDEVHMLTTQAFNALLKTLEEPPSHVIFILATTEIHKIPLTILSRCQKFQFTKIDDLVLVNRLNYIAKNEEKEISDDILYEIARMSEGGCRDAINLLDQLITYKNEDYSLEDLYNITGTTSYQSLGKLLLHIKNNEKSEIISFIEKLDKDGKNISKFIKDLIILLKDVLVFKNSNKKTNIDSKNNMIEECSTIFNEKEIYQLINELNNVSNQIKISDYDSILFTIAILNISEQFNENLPVENNKKISDNNEKEQEKPVDDSKVSSEINIEQEKQSIEKNKLINIRVNNTFVSANKNVLIKYKESWNRINDFLLDNKYSFISGLLNDTIPVAASSSNLILSSDFDSTADRINENLEIAESLLKKIYNEKVKVICLTTFEWKKEKDKYIENTKKKIKYSYLDESEDKKKDNKKVSPVDQLLDLVGEDLIEYK